MPNNPAATPEDRETARLLIELAKIDPVDAVHRLLPVITAARLWAESNIPVVNKGNPQ